MIMDLLQKRRSIRDYTEENIPEEKLQKILQAGLLYPSGKALYPLELIVLWDKAMLLALSQAKNAGASMLKTANAAIVVLGDSEKSDTWIEDASLAMIFMQLAATELGVGSCWVHCRNRFSSKLKEKPLTEQGEEESPNYLSCDEHIHSLLRIPEKYRVEAVLALGMPAKTPPAHPLPSLDSEKLHYGSFGGRAESTKGE